MISQTWQWLKVTNMSVLKKGEITMFFKCLHKSRWTLLYLPSGAFLVSRLESSFSICCRSLIAWLMLSGNVAVSWAFSRFIDNDETAAKSKQYPGVSKLELIMSGSTKLGKMAIYSIMTVYKFH